MRDHDCLGTLDKASLLRDEGGDPTIPSFLLKLGVFIDHCCLLFCNDDFSLAKPKIQEIQGAFPTFFLENKKQEIEFVGEQPNKNPIVQVLAVDHKNVCPGGMILQSYLPGTLR